MACSSPFVKSNRSASDTRGKLFNRVSCGRCNKCKKARRNAWLFRLTKEAERWKYKYFITLTYDQDNLPYSDFVEDIDVETGEISYLVPMPTLCVADVQKFFKLLRYHSKADIKYYVCGEYGRGGRPHYHAIIFTDLQFDMRIVSYKKSQPLYNSKLLSKSWHNGFNTIDILTNARVGYVLKYLTKPVRVIPNTLPQFATNSNSMGSNVFTSEMVNFWLAAPSNFYCRLGEHIIPMPKYYKDLLLRDIPEYRQAIHHYLNELVPEREAEKFRAFKALQPNKDVNVVLNNYEYVQQNVVFNNIDTSIL